ncbi:MAG: hypothetical protein K0R65_2169 [Crocinitomicaceae bacterium]|jgi:Spy/CpxP family protein refolding chaperone|nr:hypothetical protein [Crocinitomicaceae bacterium]
MKTIILSLCLLLGTQLAFGQEKTKQRKTPEQRAEMMTNRLSEEVKLTPEQREKIYSINLRSAEKSMKIHKEADLTDEQRKEKLQKHRRDVKKLVMAELTPEQQKTLKEKHKARKKEHMQDGE